MGNLDRAELLKEYAKEEPENPFNWYALAMEYLSIDTNESEKYFNKLLSSFEAYLPTYYTAASFFSEQQNLEKAKETFEKGITLAQEKQEYKTLQELKNAYQNFLFENDLD